MTHSQRFREVMTGGTPDRLPLYDFNYWRETLPTWHEQGLDAQWTCENVYQYFGLDASLGGGGGCFYSVGLKTGLMPPFEEEVLEQTTTDEVIRNTNGVIVQRSRVYETIPTHIGHTLVDRASWIEHYLPRLQPDDPRRMPDNYQADIDKTRDPNFPYVRMIGAGSLFGWLRDWMGLENFVLVPYDDPAWFEEMTQTLGDLSVYILEHAFKAGGKFDCISMWEDMAYNAGPLLSPAFFVKYIKPHYQRIGALAQQYDCPIVFVDCDGKIDEYLPHWLDVGINCMFPLEIGNWADPVRYRQQFGKSLRMMGGFNKHILAQSTQAIDAEIDRLTPVVEEGGFIPFCDHRVPPDVSLQHYEHYCRRVRERWGKGVALEPVAIDAQPIRK